MKYYHDNPSSETGRSSYSIQEAKSGRATCKKCKCKIDNGALRIGHHVDFFRGGDYPSVSWHHVRCFQLPKWFKKERRDFYCDILTDNTKGQILSNEESLAELLGEKRLASNKYSTYCIEEARSGRSGCKKCKKKISKGELRIGFGTECSIAGWVHVGCFTIPDHFKGEYTGNTANYDFLVNQINDNTELGTLDNEDKLLTLSKNMGTDLDSSNENKKGSKASLSKKKRKAKTTSASCKKAKA